MKKERNNDGWECEGRRAGEMEMGKEKEQRRYSTSGVKRRNKNCNTEDIKD